MRRKLLFLLLLAGIITGRLSAQNDPCDATPINLDDDCADVTTFNEINYTMAGTSSLDGSCTADNETTQSVIWLQVTATNGSITITNNTDYVGPGAADIEDKDFIIYSGTCTNLTEVACLSEVQGAGGTGTVTGLTAGQTYYIMASRSAVSEAAGCPTCNVLNACFTSTVPTTVTVTNDVCSSAFSLTTNVTYNATNSNATSQGPICSGSVENEVWYQWCAPANWPAGQTAYITVNNQVCNTTSGLQLSVWNTGTTCPTLATNATVICQNPGTLTNYYYSWIPTAGTCYYVTVDGFAGTACNYDITIAACIVPTATASNTGPYCAGTTIQLNGGTGTSYSWSGPNGFSSSSQNPTISSASTAATGAYTVTVTASSFQSGR